MEITQAKPNDLIEILYLLRVCISDMHAKGLKYWNSAYPSKDLIEKDLNNGCIYLVKDNRVCKGMVTLSCSEPDEYRQVQFRFSSDKPLFMQRLAVHPAWQESQLANLLVEFAQKFAMEHGCSSIRTDVHQSSRDDRSFCEGQHFTEVGAYQAGYQQVPFICYEKQL